jgi:hypothetical protein
VLRENDEADDIVSRVHRECGWDSKGEERIRSGVRGFTFVGTGVVLGAWALCWHIGGWWTWGPGSVVLRYGVILLGISLHYLTMPGQLVTGWKAKATVDRLADASTGLWIGWIAAPQLALVVLPALEVFAAAGSRRLFWTHQDWARLDGPVGSVAKVCLGQLVGYVAGTVAHRLLV